MRDIKFRAWYVTDGRMITVGDKNKYAQLESLSELFRMASINNYELMQYTGLQDKNGVEIYEGDIMRFKDRNLAAVIFETGEFHVKIPPGNGFLLEYWNGHNFYVGEVVGNIYESTELLK